MLRLGNDMTRWLGAIQSAVLVLGGYSGWLVVFKRWCEPALRRCAGAILGSSIVWLPAGGRFRIWGLKDEGRIGADATVGFLCSLTVLCAAVLPACALGVIASGQTNDLATRAAISLTMEPMIAVFVLQMLWRTGGLIES